MSYEFILLSDQYLKKDEEPFLKNIHSTIHVHLREMSIMVEFFPGLKIRFLPHFCVKNTKLMKDKTFRHKNGSNLTKQTCQ